jgi:hypothetical protein
MPVFWAGIFPMVCQTERSEDDPLIGDRYDLHMWASSCQWRGRCRLICGARLYFNASSPGRTRVAAQGSYIKNVAAVWFSCKRITGCDQEHCGECYDACFRLFHKISL